MAREEREREGVQESREGSLLRSGLARTQCDAQKPLTRQTIYLQTLLLVQQKTTLLVHPDVQGGGGGQPKEGKERRGYRQTEQRERDVRHMLHIRRSGHI